MAIALVGSVGAVSVGTTTVTPAFGQATTAGNFLVAVVSGQPGSPSTSASGWTLVDANVDNIWYKLNCGAGETAPTFAETSGTYVMAALSEWSGVATSSPVDRSTVASIAASTQTLPGADADASDLCVFIATWSVSKSGTATFSRSWTPAGGTSGTLGDDGTTKGLRHSDGGYYLLNGHGGGSADSITDTITLSTGVVNNTVIAMVSFLPASTANTYTKAGFGNEHG